MLVLSLQGVVFAQSLQELVQQANQAAHQEQYAKAISLYEQVLQQVPQEATLKRNLSVVYFNYAAQLQQEKKYDEAALYFDKSLALQPDEPTVIRAKAASFYYQGMELRESGLGEFSAIQALFQKAMDLDPSESAFQKGMASVLMDEARAHLDAEQFEEAAVLLEKAHQLDPQADVIRESRVNLYLKLARDAGPSEKNQQQSYIGKALALDNSESTRQKIENVLNPPKVSPGSAPMPTHPFQGSVSKATRQQAPQETITLSVVEMLQEIERELQVEPAPKSTLKSRLAAAEVQVYGTEQHQASSQPLNVRTKQLYGTLFGKSANLGDAQFSDAPQSPVETSQNSYLSDIFSMTEGKVIRWGKFPLRVYIDEPEKKEGFNPEYVKAIKEGLELWTHKTDNFVSFVVVKSRLSADVQIDWGEIYTDRFEDIEDLPDYSKKYDRPKRNPLIPLLGLASMAAPGFYSLAPQALGAALEYKRAKQFQAIIDESKITLGLAPLKTMSPEEAHQTLKMLVAHEFGHILGLKGHSPEPGDLMYGPHRLEGVDGPSPRDIETLRQLYNRPANVVLNLR
jgi:predicted Zn-dependent protease